MPLLVTVINDKSNLKGIQRVQEGTTCEQEGAVLSIASYCKGCLAFQMWMDLASTMQRGLTSSELSLLDLYLMEGLAGVLHLAHEPHVQITG